MRFLDFSMDLKNRLGGRKPLLDAWGAPGRLLNPTGKVTYPGREIPQNSPARKGASTGLSKSFVINGRNRWFGLRERNSFWAAVRDWVDNLSFLGGLANGTVNQPTKSHTKSVWKNQSKEGSKGRTIFQHGWKSNGSIFWCIEQRWPALRHIRSFVFQWPALSPPAEPFRIFGGLKSSVLNPRNLFPKVRQHVFQEASSEELN
jgi:hypothetical protein